MPGPQPSARVQCGPYAKGLLTYDDDRAFPVAASRVWNSLPHHVTSAQSLPFFCSCLKTSLQTQFSSTILLCPRSDTCHYGHINRSYLLTYTHTHTPNSQCSCTYAQQPGSERASQCRTDGRTPGRRRRPSYIYISHRLQHSSSATDRLTTCVSPAAETARHTSSV